MVNYTSIGAGPSSPGWELLQEVTLAGEAQVVVTNIPTGKDVLIVARNVTKSVSGLLALQVSLDNGATFVSTGYLTLAATGVPSGASFLPFHNTNATAARTGVVQISGAPPLQLGLSLNMLDNTFAYLIPATLAPVNALRVLPTAGGTLPTGIIQVYVK